MLTVMASATSDKLTLLENVKEALGVTDSVDDQFIDRLILRASRRVESYVGRPLLLQTYQAILPSYGGVDLQLPRYPITSVSAVYDGTDTGSALTATDYRIEAEAGCLNRDEGWAWTAQQEQGALSALPVPNGEYKNWRVEFSAGYVGPGGTSSTMHGNSSTGQTLPYDIEDATIELVKSAYRAKGRADDVQSERVGEVSVTYKSGQGAGGRGLPETVQALLDPYRSVI